MLVNASEYAALIQEKKLSRCQLLAHIDRLIREDIDNQYFTQGRVRVDLSDIRADVDLNKDIIPLLLMKGFQARLLLNTRPRGERPVSNALEVQYLP